jgi:hypothetical protein
MARVAGQAAGVISGYDLGEIFGLGAVGFVAAGADYRSVELWRFDVRRVVSVFRLRSVAGFTCDYHVFAEFLLVDYVDVAGFADVVSGVGDWAGGGFGDGVGTVMAVLAETLRDYGGAQDYERDERENHHGD